MELFMQAYLRWALRYGGNPSARSHAEFRVVTQAHPPWRSTGEELAWLSGLVQSDPKRNTIYLWVSFSLIDPALVVGQMLRCRRWFRP